MENKFKLGQRVRSKSLDREEEVREILIRESETKYYITNFGWKDSSDLELVKEKRKVVLYAPLKYRDGKVCMPHFYNEDSKADYIKDKEVIGWHSISVEVDE
jgi:hypothetical protein